MTKSDRKRIDAALRRAQSGTSSHVAVRIVPEAALDAFERAKDEFIARNMHARAGANAALILVAPMARTFAVIGDRELHDRVGQPFWDETVAQMSRAFISGSPADAIMLGIDRLGAVLHEHFSQAGQ